MVFLYSKLLLSTRSVLQMGTTDNSRLAPGSSARQRALLTPDEVQTPPRGNATILTHYVTESYATQMILFARLGRLGW